MPSRYTLSASHTGRKCSCNNILVCPRFRCLVAATSNMRAASPSLGSSDTHTPFHLLTDHCRPAVCPLPRPKCVDITACATSTPTACQTHRPAAAAVVAREAHGFTQALLPYHSSFINDHAAVAPAVGSVHRPSGASRFVEHARRSALLGAVLPCEPSPCRARTENSPRITDPLGDWPAYCECDG